MVALGWRMMTAWNTMTTHRGWKAIVNQQEGQPSGRGDGAPHHYRRRLSATGQRGVVSFIVNSNCMFTHFTFHWVLISYHSTSYSLAVTSTCIFIVKLSIMTITKLTTEQSHVSFVFVIHKHKVAICDWSIPISHLCLWFTYANLLFVICDGWDMGTCLKQQNT